MLAPFHYAFVQRGLLEVLLLSTAAGLLGVWIVLRGLAFYSHAVGASAFPGLVLADGLGFAAPVGALAAALLFAFGVERLARRPRGGGNDTLTALVLVGALAIGVILATDVFHSGAHVDTLLFGSLLLVGARELALATAASVLVLVASVVLGRRWVAAGFDPVGGRALGLGSPLPDAALLLLVALGIVSALATLGALLATALFVVPAATVRLLTRRLLPWQLGSVALVAAEGTAGLWLSIEANVPPGPAIAVLAGCVFALTAAARVAGTRVRAAGALAGAVVLLAGCGAAGTDGDDGRLRVVATTTQIADWARNVGGRDVDVHQILRPNTDPHEYEPRPRDVIATAGAKVVLENGDELDAWMTRVLSAAGGRRATVVLGDRVPDRVADPRAEAEGSRLDPHWWHDPRNAIAAVGEIRDALAHADPAHASAYRRSAAAYSARIAALDRAIAACMAAVPRADRKLVTDHDAFGSFAARYGIRVVGAAIPSQSTQAGASAGETARLIALVRREHVRAVFPEHTLSAKLVRAIAAAGGARSDLTLWGDSLGPRGSTGATYLSMERANADAIVRGLTGGRRRCR